MLCRSDKVGMHIERLRDTAFSLFMSSTAVGLICLSPCLVLGAPRGTLSGGSVMPGEYVTEGGWGSLTIRGGRDSSLAFSLKSVGPNEHICALDGQIVQGRATLDTYGNETACVVDFRAINEGIDVTTSSPDQCRSFCGARAAFEGPYLKPVKGCDAGSISRSRYKFKRLYHRKAYADAYETLAPLFEKCTRTMDWLTVGSLRNDLAITQYRLGHPADCLATLAPLAGDASMTDEEAREKYLPEDWDDYEPIIRATRTTLAICTKGT
jgi:hypothetical protein